MPGIRPQAEQCAECVVQMQCALRAVALTGEVCRRVIIAPRSKTIYWEASAPDVVYIVRSGSVRLGNVTDAGIEHTRAIATVGDLVGFEAVVGEPGRIHSAVARQASELCAVASRDVCRLTGQRDDLRSMLLAEICAFLLRRDHEHAACIEGTATTRAHRVAQTVTARFVQCEQLYGHRVATLTQRELAGLLGVAEETISRVGRLRAPQNADHATSHDGPRCQR